MRRTNRNWTRCAALLISIAVVGCNDNPSTTSGSAFTPTTPVATGGAGKASDQSEKGTPPTAHRSAALKITADALTKEVIADAKAAQAKYNGKVIELDGRVDSAKKLLNGYGFTLRGAKEDATDIIGVIVMCKVPDRAALAKGWRLTSGQKVKVIGTVTITTPPRTVLLADCTFELQELATVPLAARELAEAVLKDADAVREKYRNPDGGDMEIIVKGTVAKLEKNDRGFRIVKLAGASGLTINFTVDERDFAALKVGDEVTMKGDFSDYYPDDKGVTVNTAFILPKE